MYEEQGKNSTVFSKDLAEKLETSGVV